MPENPSEETEKEIIVPEHSRQKRGRRKLPEDLPRIDVTHDIDPEEKYCDCGTELSRIGEDISEKLDIIPAQLRVIRNIRPKYACKNCEDALSNDKSVKIAPVPPQIIPKGLATAGLLAYVLVGKFCDALPFYRQEKQFVRLGIDIPRQTMCNWAMKAAEACQPILTLLHQYIRGGPLICIDETPVQVLDEPGRTAKQKSYMWVFKGGDLKEEVRKKRFREDLWYRLKIFPITIPPLRDRTEDIHLLVDHFVQLFSRKMGKKAAALKITNSSMQALQSYPWPGNVRKLKHVVESALITSKNNKLHFELPKIADAVTRDLQSFEAMEREYILEVLKAKNWKIEGRDSASAILELPPSTLRSRIKKLGLKRP